jgi:hypothetical protein
MEKPDAETLVVEPANDTARKSAPDTTARSPDQAAETTYQVSARQEAVARHGETAVAIGEDLLERLVEVGREIRDSEARMGRYREGDEGREARFEKLAEATANYNQILHQAVRGAVDGNGYIRETRWHRDLETAIALEDLRHDEQAQFHDEFRSWQSDPVEGLFQAGDTGRPEAPHQHITRLGRIEQGNHAGIVLIGTNAIDRHLPLALRIVRYALPKQ